MKPIRVKKKKPSSQKASSGSRQSKRWLLNGFIGLLAFINGLILLITFLAITYKSSNPDAPIYTTEIYSVAFFVSLANIFFLINLFKLRSWAFWGYVISTLASIGLNVYIGTPVGQALLALGGPIILFGLLYMGGRRSAWYEMYHKKPESKNA